MLLWYLDGYNDGDSGGEEASLASSRLKTLCTMGRVQPVYDGDSSEDRLEMDDESVAAVSVKWPETSNVGTAKASQGTVPAQSQSQSNTPTI